FNRLFTYKRALKILLYFMLPLVTYALLQKFSGFDPIMGNWKMDWGVQNNSLTRELFNMYLTYINVFQFHFFIMLSFLLMGRMHPALRSFLFVLIILFLVSFVFSGSRAIVGAVLCGAVAQMFLSRKAPYILIMLLVLVVSAIAYKTSPHFKLKADSTVQHLAQAGDVKRFQIYNTHLAMFKDHPIKGVGYGINEPVTFEYYKKLGITQDTGFRGHSHNIFIQMLSGTGLLGTIPFLALWIILFIMTIKAYNTAERTHDWYNTALCNGLFGGFVSFIVNGFFEWNFGDYETNHNLMFFIAIAGYVWLKQKQQAQKLRKII
ncbi:MAG: O-antigen ligase family protein, partial [Pseudomonadota bacterium]